MKKNALSVSKVLLYYEIGTFTKEVLLKFEVNAIFLFFQKHKNLCGMYMWYGIAIQLIGNLMRSSNFICLESSLQQVSTSDHVKEYIF